MFLFFSGLVHVRVSMRLLAVFVVVLVLDVLVIVGRVGVSVNLVTVLVLVFMGRFLGVLGHRFPYCWLI